METVSVHTSGCQVSVRTQVCRPLPSLFPPPVPPSASPGACTSESELFRFPMIQRSITEDGCSLKKEIDDGYEAGHVIHHFEYYLDWPCKAVTWAGLREREREQERAQSRTWASSDGWAKLLHCSFPDTRGAALLCSLIHPLAARFCAWKGKIKRGVAALENKT